MILIETFQSKENTVSYSKYYHLSSYLQQKYLEIVRYGQNEKNIAIALGYNYDNTLKRSQFRQTIKRMNNFCSDIPLKYLDLINAESNVINLCLEEDLLAYKRQLEIPRYPKVASFRYTACVYGSLSFPEDSTEKEAIHICQEHLKTVPVKHVINYPNFLTIFVSSDGIHRCYYPPTIRFTKKTLMIMFKEKKILYRSLI